MSQRRRGSVVGWIFGVVLLVIAGVSLWQHQFIADSVRAWRFTPQDEVAQLADSVMMTDRGRRLFYASHSILQPAAQFNDSCENVEKTSAVLGCYASRQIFLYDIDSEELAGIKEVTAAHEMLHAAYDRLSSSQRRNVDRLLDIQAEHLRSNEEFQQRIEAYDFESADERYNELHSIIPTEIAVITPELERYYAQYFTDRSRVVALHQQYSGVFQSYQQQAEQMAAAIDRQAAMINAANDSYRRSVQALDSDIAAFNQRAQTPGGFASQAEFDGARSQLMARQSTLEQERQRLTSQIDQYNSLLDEYNGIARHLTSLNNSIDSRVAPTPEVE